MFHTHQPYTSALTCMKGKNRQLRMIHQNCLRYYQSIVYKDTFSGLVDNNTEGIEIANYIKKGGKRARAIMMANHGVTMIGSNCAEALEDLYYLERAAMV